LALGAEREKDGNRNENNKKEVKIKIIKKNLKKQI
jgi:hypothetical protein